MFFFISLTTAILKSNANGADDNPSSSLRQVKEASGKFTSEPIAISGNQSETAQDLNAAKVAAMKAAELGEYLIPLLVFYNCDNICCHCEHSFDKYPSSTP